MPTQPRNRPPAAGEAAFTITSREAVCLAELASSHAKLRNENARLLADKAALVAALERAEADIDGYINSTRNKSLGQMRADIRAALAQAKE